MKRRFFSRSAPWILLVLPCLHGLLSCGGKGADPPTSKPVRVLFVGNSYTFYNQMPKIFAELARSAGRAAEVDKMAKGGWSLTNHLESKETQAKIAEGNWDFVVLQEQSILPSAPGREKTMYPSARDLAGAARKAGAAPVFYVTWGRRDGLRESGHADRRAMQQAVQEGYEKIAEELDAPLAPVGPAWEKALEKRGDLALFHPDGSHPSRMGSYLAACVFFAVIFRESPEGLGHTAFLDKDTAAFLQEIAARTVLDDPARWNLR
ncbi:MAG: DUF4886 domain-containing protein [Planctomycetota bacterium]|jgi:hypothetical protein